MRIFCIFVSPVIWAWDRIRGVWNCLGEQKNSNAFMAVLTFCAVVAAFYIGLVQNSINKQLVDANYEPSLLFEFVKPNNDVMSWINIRNEGKSNIRFYEILIGGATTSADVKIIEREVIDGSRFSTIIPGGLINITNGQFLSEFNKALTTEDINAPVPLYVYFKTGDGKKYIMQTIAHIFGTPTGNAILSGAVSYRVFDWKESKQ